MRARGLVALGLIVVAVLAIVPADALAQGCAMCKTALDGPLDPTSEAFSISVLFLMVTPYTILGTLGVWMYLSARHGDGDVDQDNDLEWTSSADKETRS